MRVYAAIRGVLRRGTVETLVGFRYLFSLTRPIIGYGLEIPAACSLAGTFGGILHYYAFIILIATVIYTGFDAHASILHAVVCKA